MSTRYEEYTNAPELKGQVVYEADWYLLSIPADGYAALIEQLGPTHIDYKPTGRPHISMMKNESPSLNKADWGTAFVGEEVSFHYNPVLRAENGLHLWVDCHSKQLCRMREHFGLVTLRRGDGAFLVNFHLTIGRRKKPINGKLRPQLRLCPQSHIDVETSMQHL